MDGTVDPSLAMPPADLACEVCGFPDDDQYMLLLCDYCNTGWHMYCLQPPLEKLPPGSCSRSVALSLLLAGWCHTVTYEQLKGVQYDRNRCRTAAPPVEPDNLFKPSNPVADKHALKQDGLSV